MKTLARIPAILLLTVFGRPSPQVFRPAEAASLDAPVSTQASAGVPARLAPTPGNLVAEHWAPTIYQETKDERDLMTAFDFDGDWDGSNNGGNVKRFAARGVLYFTVAETPTHWIATYVTYHPVDAKSISGHDHDSEHLTLVVRKDGSTFGKLEAMETRFHKVMYQYATAGAGVENGADNIDGTIHVGADGRPEVYSQRVGHGLCGGYAPTGFFDTLALRCNHQEVPHISHRGVVYRYTGHADTPRSLDDRDVGYALVEIGDTLWAHAHERGPHATFASLMDFRGDRCGLFQCPRGIGAVLAARPGRLSTGMPWEEGSGRGVQGRGQAFFDPAFTLSRRLRFPKPFSTGYLSNPYLGVGSFGGSDKERVADSILDEKPRADAAPPPAR